MRVFQGYVAVLFAVLALAVGGCGGGNDDSAADSKPSVARGTTGKEGATRPQAPSDGTGGAKATADEPKQRDSGNNGAAGANDPEPAPPADSTPEQEKPKPQQRTLEPAEAKHVGRELAKQARTICKALTLEGLAKEYDMTSRDPDELAKAYAATYPVAIRKAVVAGCKKGLLESQ